MSNLDRKSQNRVLGTLSVLAACIALYAFWPERGSNEALIKACRSGTYADVENELNKGANPNKVTKGQLPLLMLVERLRTREARFPQREPALIESNAYRSLVLLLDRGANPTRRVNGVTPLSEAARTTKVEGLELFLKSHPNVRVQDRESNTALHVVGFSYHRAQPGKHDSSLDRENSDMRQCVHLLVNAGIPVNSRNRDGRTPLHLAALNGFIAVAEALIADGADLNAKDIGGLTPLECSLTIEMHDYLAKMQKDRAAH